LIILFSESTDVAMKEDLDLSVTPPDDNVNQRPGFTSENFKIELQGIPKFFGAAQVLSFIAGFQMPGSS
jgi:hypothetical protein